MRKLSTMSSEEMDVFKIVLLGDVGVGKTALLVRFLCRRYLGEYDPTIEDAYSKKISLDGRSYVIEVLDTADKGEGTTRRKEFMSTASLFIIAFSTIDSKSFQSVMEYKKTIEQCTQQQQIHVGLIGTKSDLTHLRQVQRNEAQSLASVNGWLYSECSAAYDINVQSIFHNMLRRANGDLGFDVKRNGSDKQLRRKQSFLNKFSSQFLRRRSCSRPVDVGEPIHNNIARTGLTASSTNARNLDKRRSYSVTTMI